MIQKDIRRLAVYGKKTGLLTKEDEIYTINRLLELFELDELEDLDEPALAEVEKTGVEDLEDILSGMLDYAYEKGILKENGVVYRDLFDTKIMSLLMPRPGEVIKTFRNFMRKSLWRARIIITNSAGILITSGVTESRRI